MAPDPVARARVTGCAFLPPHVTERLAVTDPQRKEDPFSDLTVAVAARTMRTLLATMPVLASIPSPRTAGRYRLIYDAGGGDLTSLPGQLVRQEGQRSRRPRDPAVTEAYTYAGVTYEFYQRAFGRDSLDDHGMAILASVHVGQHLNNAFWTGEQMAFGDGDDRLFVRFTKGLDVMAHELTHGVIAHTCRLTYAGEPGAISEHLADVMAVLAKAWPARQTARTMVWTVGEAIMGPTLQARAIRTFTAARAYEHDPLLGTDPQPKHMRDLQTGSADHGGVHLNSGILNHAFYQAAMRFPDAEAWRTMGRVWYEAMRRLPPDATFVHLRDATIHAAGVVYGPDRPEQEAVREAWGQVGL
jgi:Zn-dependent metalloprotease